MKCAAFEADGRTHILYAEDHRLLDAARSYVPRGVPFIIMNTDDLPSRETRDTWSFDYTNPEGVGQNDAYVPTE